MTKDKIKIITILGPTATGKSDLAVRLAKKFNGEVVSADSRQTYRGLNIGSGKITRAEMKGVRHHMLDIAGPKKQFSAAEYAKQARVVISEILKREKLPIICGGTGFYISALLGEQTISETPPNPKLRQKLSGKTASELFAILKKLDPKRAETIERQNPRRLIRAIEIAKDADFARTSRGPDAETPFNVLKIGLHLPKEQLIKKINERLAVRIRKGMIAEARRLHKKGLSWRRMDELGLEYRYMAKHIKGLMTLEEMSAKLKTEIWRYSKRQMTWFKRDKNTKWFFPEDFKKIQKTIGLFLVKKK